MKKVLIISNAALSNTDSNGRTVANLFNCYDKECLAQFCTYNAPDFSLCNNFYKVTDSDALKSILKLKALGGKVAEKEDNSLTQKTSKSKIKKTPLKMILREIVWGISFWKGKRFKHWLAQVNPNVIFLNLADNCFTIKLAISIAKKYSVPIIAFSTENYYFKDFNYLTKKKSFGYTIFYSMIKRSYKSLQKYCIKCFLNTESLCDLYKNEFSFSCATSYAKSNLDFIPNYAVNKEQVKVSYLGNLGLNRHKALIEIAEALNSINSNLTLDVYGRIPNKEIEEEFNACGNINLKGFVNYEQVVKVMHESSLLIHAEHLDDFLKKDLAFAFSTKIADTISSGTPMFLYADESLAETKFLLNNKCAFVATNKSELKQTLNSALFDEQKRKDIIEISKAVSEKRFKCNSEVVDFINAL